MPNTDPKTPGRSAVTHFHNYTPWVNVVLGLLVFTLRYASPRGTFAVHWNLFVSGIVIMFAALATSIAHDGNSPNNYWSMIDAAAGVWLLVSVKVIPSILQVTIAETLLGALIIAMALASLAIEFYHPQAIQKKTGAPEP